MFYLQIILHTHYFRHSAFSQLVGSFMRAHMYWESLSSIGIRLYGRVGISIYIPKWDHERLFAFTHPPVRPTPDIIQGGLTSTHTSDKVYRLHTDFS